jgi:tetratricopeptide (TPR) repeat protein
MIGAESKGQEPPSQQELEFPSPDEIRAESKGHEEHSSRQELEFPSPDERAQLKERSRQEAGAAARPRRRSSIKDLHHQVVVLNEVGRELFELDRHSPSAYHFGEALDLLIGLLNEDYTSESEDGDEDVARADKNKKRTEKGAQSTEFFSKWLKQLELSLIEGTVCCFPIDPKYMTFSSTLQTAALTVMHNLASVHYQAQNYKQAEDILKLAVQEIQTRQRSEENGERKKTMFVLLVMSIYYCLGKINAAQHRSQNAMICFLDGINYGKEYLGIDHVLSAHIYTTMGKKLFENGYHTEGMLAFEEASKIFDKVGKVGGFGIVQKRKKDEKARAKAA